MGTGETLRTRVTIGVLGIAALGGILTGIATAQAPVNHVPAGLPACVSEDSTTDCFWDASTRGNGQGVSFVILHGESFPIESGTGIPVCQHGWKMSQGATCYGDSNRP